MSTDGTDDDLVRSQPVNFAQTKVGYVKETIVKIPMAMQLKKANTSIALVVARILFFSFSFFIAERSVFVLKRDSFGNAFVQKGNFNFKPVTVGQDNLLWM